MDFAGGKGADPPQFKDPQYLPLVKQGDRQDGSRSGLAESGINREGKVFFRQISIMNRFFFMARLADQTFSSSVTSPGITPQLTGITGAINKRFFFMQIKCAHLGSQIIGQIGHDPTGQFHQFLLAPYRIVQPCQTAFLPVILFFTLHGLLETGLHGLKIISQLGQFVFGFNIDLLVIVTRRHHFGSFNQLQNGSHQCSGIKDHQNKGHQGGEQSKFNNGPAQIIHQSQGLLLIHLGNQSKGGIKYLNRTVETQNLIAKMARIGGDLFIHSKRVFGVHIRGGKTLLPKSGLLSLFNGVQEFSVRIEFTGGTFASLTNKKNLPAFTQ